MPFYSKNVKRLMAVWPGKHYFGLYRFLPLFFVLGAALEFSMINWQVGEISFYRVYKRRQAEKVALAEQRSGDQAASMPAGVSWGRYLRFFTAAMLSMFAGAQVVHLVYKPLDDMVDLIEKEKLKQTSKEQNSSPEKS